MRGSTAIMTEMVAAARETNLASARGDGFGGSSAAFFA